MTIIRPEGGKALLNIGLVVIVALLWFLSPSYIHNARTWYRLYGVCVAEAPPAGTLRAVMSTRSRCARLARELAR
jgi:hypothetical protein